MLKRIGPKTDPCGTPDIINCENRLLGQIVVALLNKNKCMLMLSPQNHMHLAWQLEDYGVFNQMLWTDP